MFGIRFMMTAHTTPPFLLPFQNILESWFFFSDICIVGLGCVYTVLYTYYDQIHLPSLFVEISILFACAGAERQLRGLARRAWLQP